MHKLPLVSLLCLLPLSAATTLVAQPMPYQDASLSTEQRLEDLLSRMTLAEKAAQLQTVWQQRRTLEDPQLRFVTDAAAKLIPHGIGHIGRPSEFKTPEQTAEFNNALQRWLKQHTRLGIPALMHEEALHGYAAFDASSLPQAIALASSWSPHIMHDVYALAAREMRATGAHWALTPILDIARDPRWGRIEETMGEDPYLMSALGVAAVRGFQGAAGKEGAFAPDKVVATLKHLTGHGQPQAGLNIAPAQIAPRELHEVFLPPFEAAVKLAHAGSIMASYNEIDGIPSHINQPLLQGVVRDNWGFNGVIVSDYFAINELNSRHHLYSTPAEAAKAALLAGVDMELPDPDTFLHLTALVQAGQLDEAAIDTAVRRVLALKFRLGLFDNPYVDAKAANALMGAASERDFARQVAERSMVLLKNNGILPLNADKIGKLAVMGPHADETLLGGYSSIPRQTVSIYQGLKQKLQGKAEVVFARGTVLTKQLTKPSTQAEQDTSQAFITSDIRQRSQAAGTFSMQRWNHDAIALADEQDRKGLLDEAVALAKSADAVVLVLGENEGLSREAWAETHVGDRTSLQLVGNQLQLAKALLATGKPVVLLLQNGRPLALGELADSMPAIIEAWYLGQETGTAVANLLFGDANPSGKLPLTFPRSAGHIPAYYNHKASAKRGYLFDDISPLYPFGHGLSYTSFNYSDLQIDASKARANGEVQISLTLQNSGSRAGTEVVQLYIKDPVASVTRPVQQLKGFARVALKRGEQATVSFTLPVNLLAFFDQQMRWVVEPGEIQLQLGSSSADIRLQGSFTIDGALTEVSDNKAYLSRVCVAKANREAQCDNLTK
ncbi:MAG: glycoside hydrolase family 3 C-terminal domain-containing protein [Gammaproteobacteria bacterium]|nr:glycoside hydrolase family 3 C-terminal domain-containing protein [Gammaproteobacteria bacterium]MBU2184209.1 glycoside hydrolase family 3 C-terminal domain-containing protein [Gammaproteobacteria bacterium]MBU2206070.1 glycoside hydrolase family 3 C-terminal domain-containing protein [Gammaproteobacteria bacterium]